MTDYEDDINLMPYLVLIARNWIRIVIVAFIAAGVGAGLNLTRPRQYEATANILLTRSRASLSLAAQFPTVNEPIDSRSRMEAILTIATSDQIALDTLAEHRDELPQPRKDLEAFKESFQVTSRGDAILITAVAEDPDLAAQLANTWSRRALNAINLAYSGESPLVEIESQVERSRTVYESAQNALESFIRENRITYLNYRLAEARTLFDKITNDRQVQISYYDERQHLLELLILQAGALKEQVERGEASQAGGTGDALAVLGLHAAVFGSGTTDSSEGEITAASPQGVRIELIVNALQDLEDNSANYSNDLAAYIQQAEVELRKTEQVLKDLTAKVTEDSDPDEVEAIAALIRDYESQLEQEDARLRELTSSRVLAWEAYQALVQKETEIKNAAQTENLVTSAGSAIPPTQPSSRGTLLIAVISAMVGAVFAIIFTLATNFRQVAPKMPE